VGGAPRNFGSSCRMGPGPFFVPEGDEYDSAFFNKQPKFLHYRPELALLTSLEFDHADIYPDFACLRSAFVRFVRLLPPHGLLMVCDEYEEALGVAKQAACRVRTYGYGEGADLRGILRSDERGMPVLEIIDQKVSLGSFSMPIPGRHNGLNVLGCVGILRWVGGGAESIRRGLEGFLGVRRRQERIGEVNGVLFLDDFAHHPTAVRETVRAVRMQHPGARVLAVFEPRTHTSRRNVFQQEYVDAFLEADHAFCLPVFRAEALSDSDRFDPELWSIQVRERGGRAEAVSDPLDLARRLLNVCKEGDVVLFMSSGNLSAAMKECMEGGRQGLDEKTGGGPPFSAGFP